MPGLIDSTEGLTYGTGLIFETGLGGAGLTNPEAVENARVFKGAGNLSVATRAVLMVSVRLSAGGTLATPGV